VSSAGFRNFIFALPILLAAATPALAGGRAAAQDASETSRPPLAAVARAQSISRATVSGDRKPALMIKMSAPRRQGPSPAGNQSQTVRNQGLVALAQRSATDGATARRRVVEARQVVPNQPILVSPPRVTPPTVTYRPKLHAPSPTLPRPTLHVTPRE
jgi:hypothetical protein